MSFTLKLNPTVTGGTDTVMSLVGLQSASQVWAFPTHTRLTPHTLSLSVGQSQTKGSEPGVARSTFKVARASRVQEEGCCTVSSGTVIFDGSLRWPLSQPESALDDVIADVRAYVNSSSFVTSIKAGLMPAAS